MYVKAKSTIKRDKMRSFREFFPFFFLILKIFFSFFHYVNITWLGIIPHIHTMNNVHAFLQEIVLDWPPRLQ